MHNTSSQYKEAIKQSGRVLTPEVKVVLSDATHVTLGTDDIIQNGFVLEDGISSPNTLQLGCACIKQLSLILNNYEGKFRGVDFTGAVLTCSVGLELSDDTKESVFLGTYTVDEATDNGNTINLTALDDMNKLDRPYSESTLSYPATLAQILRDCCSSCGVLLQTQTFLNSTYRVLTRPEDQNLTFRQMVSYVAQLAGCWARINSNNRLVLDWFDFDRFSVEGPDLDGNVDTADGNNYDCDGGLFLSPIYGEGSHLVLQPAELDQLQSATIANTDIIVTGVQIVPDNDEEPIYLSGKEGYVISIENNPLIQSDYANLVGSIWDKIYGLQFRPCQVSSRGDPSWEAGDVAYVTDAKGIKHRTVISNLSYSIDGWEKISADAETVSRKQSSYSNNTKIVQVARKVADKQLSDYDLQAKNLNDLMANSMGFYQTKQTQPDGSVVAYLHDKPTLEESVTIWKNTAEGFAVSTDGGITWGAGMDANGNAVVNVLSAKGINADWIKTGRIESSTNPKIYFDLEDAEIAASKLISPDNIPIIIKIGKVREGDNDLDGYYVYKDDTPIEMHAARTNFAADKFTDKSGVGIYSYGDIRLDANIGSTDSFSGNTIGMLRLIDGSGLLLANVGTSGGETNQVIWADGSQSSFSYHPSSGGGDGSLNLASGYSSISSFDGSNRTTMDIMGDRIELTVCLRDGYAEFSPNRADIDVPLYVQGVEVTSDRSKKENIQPVDCKALEKIQGLKFYQYDLTRPLGSDKLRMATITGYDDDTTVAYDPIITEVSDYHVAMGIMYDEAPEEIRTHDGQDSKSIDLYAYINLLAKAVQELTQKVETLEAQIKGA